MPFLYLVRHAQSTANSDGVLAGRMPGISLDKRGKKQAEKLSKFLATVEFEKIIASPLERTQETAAILRADAEIKLDYRISECDYGQWSGQKIEDLQKLELWREIQKKPSSVTFPEGESMQEMFERAWSSVEFWNQEVTGNYLMVSHADVIKAIVARALGMHLDNFQRIAIRPASLTVISFNPEPMVMLMNLSLDNVRKSSSKPTIGGGK
ncbi:MAG: MSMEG_4193 family putative phosphomutase [Candidatus Nanopelagicales bacterium]